MTTTTVATALSDLKRRAHTPYSGHPDAALVVLSDGAWLPGVRVENASFSLTISAAVNALTTAVTFGRTDIVGIATTAALRHRELDVVKAIADAPLDRVSPTQAGTLPKVLSQAPLPLSSITLPADALAAARQIATRAHVPESNFPVGCIALTPDGIAIPGVNVETDDWASILCAERNALSTALSYGHTSMASLTLTCPRDASGTPCGSCRQVIVELAAGAKIACDRHESPVEVYRPAELLPAFFVGGVLRST